MASYKYTKGLNVETLLTLDPDEIMDMKSPQLREVVSRLSATANKRLKRMTEKYPNIPVVAQTKAGGKFSTKGKDLTSLRNEYLRAREFLNDPNTTITGWKRTEKALANEMKKEGWTVNPNDIPELLLNFNKLTGAEGIDLTRGERYKYAREIEEVVVEGANRSMKSSEAILDSFATALQRVGYSMDGENYERTFEDGVSQFFDLQ